MAWNSPVSLSSRQNNEFTKKDERTRMCVSQTASQCQRTGMSSSSLKVHGPNLFFFSLFVSVYFLLIGENKLTLRGPSTG
ncbi:hypothetical protein BP00DRAFT_85534 [Aspergillus indologenus CBS 114.80]|uniref:Uncharacterized protein n=1 Tax=Aspergillus indologenus CBS 114.80 TaxID=1450541 RepID=A0A2V5IBE5_9EURO|nr:hypothetical protein BP00DRAFT_85534 [Aspergillus indologenus CBS 114.80]